MVMESITDIKALLTRLEAGQKILLCASGVNIALTASVLFHLLSR